MTTKEQEQDLVTAYLIAERAGTQDKSKYEKELVDLYRRMEKGEYQFKSMAAKEVARRVKLRIDLRGEIEHIPGSPAYEDAKKRFEGRKGGRRTAIRKRKARKTRKTRKSRK